MDFLFYLLSDNFCFAVIIHLSSNKTSSFYSQKLLFYSVRKRSVCSCTPFNERVNRTEREEQSSSFYKETICCLLTANTHSSLTFSHSFCPFLSLFFFISLPPAPASIKLLTSNPITLQFVFSMPLFSLEIFLKC